MIRNGLNQTISKRCANENVELLRGVDCEILHQLERGTKYSL